MPWPTPQDYNEAVQNPRSSFLDPELQAGHVETTPLGLPRPITGNFASVYRFHCARRDWAVRCFWRELNDMQDRYAAMSEHLRAVKLPYTVDFEYQPQGIRIRGTWYPILKMEWQEGQLLNEYLSAHRGEPDSLRTLADEWMRMVTDLARCEIAHGDLQHGNVLVEGGRLRLVDYDGMWVPALLGRGSHELGRQHYQHPGRTAETFDSNLDRFSAWTIYLSILALAQNPDLWHETGAGEEHLLFTRDDFSHPENSTTFTRLLTAGDPEVESATRTLKGSALSAVDAVPPLSQANHRDGGDLHSQAGRPGTYGKAVAAWRRLVPPVIPKREPAPDSAPSSHPAWLAGYLEPPPAGTIPPLVNDPRTVRACLIALGPLVGTCWLLLKLYLVPLTASIVAVCVLWCVASAIVCVVAYRHDPLVRPICATNRRRARLGRALRRIERTRHELNESLRQSVQREGLERQATRTRATAVEERRRGAEAKRCEESARRVSGVDEKIAATRVQESQDREGLLASQQSQHVTRSLRRTLLVSADLGGTRAGERGRLLVAGIWSAGDVSDARVRALRHVSSDTVRELVAWKVGALRDAERTMPRRIQGADAERLARSYLKRYSRLLKERAEVEAMSHPTVDARLEPEASHDDQALLKKVAQREEDRAGIRLSLIDLGEQEDALLAEFDALRAETDGAPCFTFGLFLRQVVGRLHTPSSICY